MSQVAQHGFVVQRIQKLSRGISTTGFRKAETAHCLPDLATVTLRITGVTVRKTATPQPGASVAQSFQLPTQL